MKAGDTRSDSTVRMIASDAEVMAGVVAIKHPRLGRVVLRQHDDGHWVVESVERQEVQS